MPNEFSFFGLSKPAPEAVNRPRDAEGMTYLHELCKRGAPPDVLREAIFDMGADLRALTSSGVSPLGIAIRHGHIETARYLLENGAETYFTPPSGKPFSAIAEAVFWGKGDMFPLLAEFGAMTDVNRESHRGPDCMFIAIDQRYPQLIVPLARVGAFVNRETMKGGLTPLHYVSREGYSTFVQPLIAAGAKIDQPNSQTGRTPLLDAAMFSNFDCVDKLLKAGANPNQTAVDGCTPLMLAADSFRGAQVVRLLVTAGADVNACQPGSRETALHIAARNGNINAVESLLAAGANPLLTDRFNVTAAKRARTSNYNETAGMIERAERVAEHAFFEKAWKRFKHG